MKGVEAFLTALVRWEVRGSSDSEKSEEILRGIRDLNKSLPQFQEPYQQNS